MNAIQDPLFTETHQWFTLTEDGIATIGISDFAQDSLGDIVHASLPSVGQSVSSDEACCTLESVKTASDVYSPVSGVVIACNPALVDTPEIINDEPYQAGWLFQVEVTTEPLVSDYLSKDTYMRMVSE